VAEPATGPGGFWSGLLTTTGRAALSLPRPVWAAVAAAWAGLIWYLSSQPGSPEGNSLVWAWAGNLAHAPLFGLLALWLALTLPRTGQGEGRWSRLSTGDLVLVAALVLAWGVTDEWHQSWVSDRTASVADMATDLVGALGTLVVARAAGDPACGEGGLRLRLALAALACVSAALVATLV